MSTNADNKLATPAGLADFVHIPFTLQLAEKKNARPRFIEAGLRLLRRVKYASQLRRLSKEEKEINDGFKAAERSLRQKNDEVVRTQVTILAQNLTLVRYEKDALVSGQDFWKRYDIDAAADQALELMRTNDGKGLTSFYNIMPYNAAIALQEHIIHRLREAGAPGQTIDMAIRPVNNLARIARIKARHTDDIH